MIAYYAQPNRFHPFLVKLIKTRYNVSALFNHFKENGVDKAVHLSNHQIEDITPEKILNLKTSEFFCGVLHPKYNVILQPDLSFTIISNPVNRIYQLYYIMKKLEEMYCNEGIIYSLYNIHNLSMEKYIDITLENNYFRERVAEHIFLLPKETESLDFVGVAEESDITKQHVQKILNMDLNNFNFEERTDFCTYRIKDIERSLQPEIDRYHRLCDRLKNTI